MPNNVTGVVVRSDQSTNSGWATNATWNNDYISASVGQYITIGEAQKESQDKTRIHAKLYFSYVKSKFKLLERIRMDRRAKTLEKAFEQAMGAGQIALSEKIMREVTVYSRESVMSAKGIKWQINRTDLDRYKKKLRNGHISDTRLSEYTRVIPQDVLAQNFEHLIEG